MDRDLTEKNLNQFPNIPDVINGLSERWLGIEKIGENLYRVNGFTIKFEVLDTGIYLDVKLDAPPYLDRGVNFAEDFADVINNNGSDNLRSVFVRFGNNNLVISNPGYGFGKEKVELSSNVYYKILSRNEASKEIPLDLVERLDNLKFIHRQGVSAVVRRDSLDRFNHIDPYTFRLGLELAEWFNNTSPEVRDLLTGNASQMDSIDEDFISRNYDEILKFYLIFLNLLVTFNWRDELDDLEYYFSDEVDKRFPRNKALPLINQMLSGGELSSWHELDIMKKFSGFDLVNIKVRSNSYVNGYNRYTDHYKVLIEKQEEILKQKSEGQSSILTESDPLFRLYKLYYILISRFNFSSQLMSKLGWNNEANPENDTLLASLRFGNSDALTNIDVEDKPPKGSIFKLLDESRSTSKDARAMLERKGHLDQIKLDPIGFYIEGYLVRTPMEFWESIFEADKLLDGFEANYGHLTGYLSGLLNSTKYSESFRENMLNELEDYLKYKIAQFKKDQYFDDQNGNLLKLILTIAIARPSGSQLLQEYLGLFSGSSNFEKILKVAFKDIKSLLAKISVIDNYPSLRASYSSFDDIYAEEVHKFPSFTVDGVADDGRAFYKLLPNFSGRIGENIVRILNIVVFLNKSEILKEYIPLILGTDTKQYFGMSLNLALFIIESGLLNDPDYYQILVILKNHIKRVIQVEVYRQRNKIVDYNDIENITEDQYGAITNEEILEYLKSGKAYGLRAKLLFEPEFWELGTTESYNTQREFSSRIVGLDNAEPTYWSNLSRTLKITYDQQLNIRRHFEVANQIGRTRIGALVSSAIPQVNEADGNDNFNTRSKSSISRLQQNIENRDQARVEARAEVAAYQELVNLYGGLQTNTYGYYSVHAQPIQNRLVIEKASQCISGYFQNNFKTKGRFRDTSVKFNINVDLVGVELLENLMCWLRPLTSSTQHAVFISSIKANPQSFLIMLKSTFFNAITRSSIGANNRTFLQYLLLEEDQDIEALLELGLNLIKIFNDDIQPASVLIDAIQISHNYDYALINEEIRMTIEEERAVSTKQIVFYLENDTTYTISVPKILKGDEVYLHIYKTFKDNRKNNRNEDNIYEYLDEYLRSKGLINASRWDDDEESKTSTFSYAGYSNPITTEQVAEIPWSDVAEIIYIGKAQGADFIYPEAFYEVNFVQSTNIQLEPPLIEVVPDLRVDAIQGIEADDLVYKRLDVNAKYAKRYVIFPSTPENTIYKLIVKSNRNLSSIARKVKRTPNGAIIVELLADDELIIHEKPMRSTKISDIDSVVIIDDKVIEFADEIDILKQPNFGSSTLDELWINLRDAVYLKDIPTIEYYLEIALKELYRICALRPYSLDFSTNTGIVSTQENADLILRELIKNKDLGIECATAQLAIAAFFKDIGLKCTLVSGKSVYLTAEGNKQFFSSKTNFGHLICMVGGKYIADFTPLADSSMEKAFENNLGKNREFNLNRREREESDFKELPSPLQEDHDIIENEKAQNAEPSKPQKASVPSNVVDVGANGGIESGTSEKTYRTRRFIDNLRDDLFLVSKYFNIELWPESGNYNLVSSIILNLLTYLSATDEENIKAIENTVKLIKPNMFVSSSYFAHLNHLTPYARRSIEKDLLVIDEGGAGLITLLSSISGFNLIEGIEDLNINILKIVGLIIYTKLIADSIRDAQADDIFVSKLNDRSGIVSGDLRYKLDREKSASTVLRAISQGGD